MLERAKRPSRLIQSIARWAITLGAAGTIVGGTALYRIYRVLPGKELASNNHGLLLLSAVLLSVAFVLAPLVRRTFSTPPLAASRAGPRTLLDEMREAPPDAGASITDDAALNYANTPPAAVDPSEAPAATAATARLVAGVYVIFAATLLLILWALQIN
jgi:hypothetical protein